MTSPAPIIRQATAANVGRLLGIRMMANTTDVPSNPTGTESTSGEPRGRTASLSPPCHAPRTGRGSHIIDISFVWRRVRCDAAARQPLAVHAPHDCAYIALTTAPAA